MKKVVLIALAIVMALGCVSAFAASPRDNGNERDLFGKVDFEAAINRVGESFLSDGIGSGENQIREDWTNSRSLDNEGAKFVNLGDEENPNVAVKATGSCYASADNNANAQGSTADVQLMAYVDLKYVKDAAFCGLILDQTAGLGSGNSSFEADSGFVLSTGYGFTLRADNVLEAFISRSAGANFDSAVYDLDDFGIDSSDWNTYEIYRTTDQKAYIAVNNILVAIIDNANGQILEADGETVGAVGQGDPSDTNADRYNTDGFPFFGIVKGNDTEVYFDNIGYEEFTTLPEFDEYEAPATEAPATEAPATEAPATEAPAEPEEPEQPNKPTGDIIAIVAIVAVAAVLVVVLKKRENA